jgi:hypothetical protein
MSFERIVELALRSSSASHAEGKHIRVGHN